MATNNTIKIDKHASFSKSYAWKDSAGDAIDLTGYTFKGQIRKTADDDAELYATLTVTVLSAVNGTFEASLTAEQTAAIPTKPQSSAQRTLSEYAYDIKAVYPSGLEKRLIEGVAQVSPGSTQV
jgi:hypothetical protein